MGSLQREEERHVGRHNGKAFGRVLLTFWLPLTWLHSGKGFVNSYVFLHQVCLGAFFLMECFM